MSVLPMPRIIPRHIPLTPARAGLVERAVAGDREAFGELYERNVERIYRFVWFQVHDTALARDITQDVFVAALRGLDKLRYAERFEAWLLRIAHHRVLNHRRTTARRPLLTLLPDGDEDDREVEPAVEDDAPGEVERRLVGEAIAAAAADLTEGQREVLALRFVGGLDLRETAAALDRSEDAVKKLQRRALAALRARLETMEQG